MKLDPRTTAVVAVHCQGDIVGPTGAFADFFQQQVSERRVIDQIAALIASAREAGAPWSTPGSPGNRTSPTSR